MTPGKEAAPIALLRDDWDAVAGGAVAEVPAPIITEHYLRRSPQTDWALVYITTIFFVIFVGMAILILWGKL